MYGNKIKFFVIIPIIILLATASGYFMVGTAVIISDILYGIMLVHQLHFSNKMLFQSN